MSHTDRLAHYFRAVGPNTLVTHAEIIDLLWRGCPHGGPLDTNRSIDQQMSKVRRRYGYQIESYKRVGFRLKEVPNG